MECLEVNRIEKVDVIIKMSQEEVFAIKTILGNMTTKDDIKFGASRKQSRILERIYNEISDVVCDCL